MQIANQIETEFSTADAEYPEIKQEDGDLTLRFKDWKENYVEVFFVDAIAFKWQMAESLLANERDDCCYEIEGSEWLELYRKQYEIGPKEQYKHYKFNFNAVGQFEVLAESYTVKT